MFCHIINRFLTRTRNIVHFGVTMNMVFTYLHTVFCVYMYIQLYTIIHTVHTHTTYIHAYILTYTYAYILIHAYTYIHTYMHIPTCIQIYIHELSMSCACIKPIDIYAFWLSSVYPSWSRFRGLWSSFLSP